MDHQNEECGLAPVAFLRNITLLSINMNVIWRASLLKNCEQANQCNNSGETEEVRNLSQKFEQISFLRKFMCSPLWPNSLNICVWNMISSAAALCSALVGDSFLYTDWDGAVAVAVKELLSFTFHHHLWKCYTQVRPNSHFILFYFFDRWVIRTRCSPTIYDSPSSFGPLKFQDLCLLKQNKCLNVSRVSKIIAAWKWPYLVLLARNSIKQQFCIMKSSSELFKKS